MKPSKTLFKIYFYVQSLDIQFQQVVKALTLTLLNNDFLFMTEKIYDHETIFFTTSSDVMSLVLLSPQYLSLYCYLSLLFVFLYQCTYTGINFNINLSHHKFLRGEGRFILCKIRLRNHTLHTGFMTNLIICI